MMRWYSTSHVREPSCTCLSLLRTSLSSSSSMSRYFLRTGRMRRRSSWSSTKTSSTLPECISISIS